MATYRMLAPHFINNTYMDAGTQQQTADIPGGLLPLNWKPSNAVEAMDAAAAAAVFAAGPSQFGLLRGQFGFIAQPQTFWSAAPIPGSSAMRYSLSGLGAGLGTICQ
jgi:hypothetical protein